MIKEIIEKGYNKVLFGEYMSSLKCKFVKISKWYRYWCVELWGLKNHCCWLLRESAIRRSKKGRGPVKRWRVSATTTKENRRKWWRLWNSGRQHKDHFNILRRVKVKFQTGVIHERVKLIFFHLKNWYRTLLNRPNFTQSGSYRKSD